MTLVAAILFSQSTSQAQSLLHIRVIEGEGLIRPAGARDGRPLTVQITDETGRPVEAATVSFKLPEEGPGGTFTRGLRTEIVTTTADGQASIFGAAWNNLPGPFQVRVTAVKGPVRAGTVVSQYISDAPQTKVRKGGSGTTKWILLAAIAGGSLAGGTMLTKSGGTSSASTGTPPPPQVGVPTISIGGAN